MCDIAELLCNDIAKSIVQIDCWKDTRMTSSISTLKDNTGMTLLLKILYVLKEGIGKPDLIWKQYTDIN